MKRSPSTVVSLCALAGLLLTAAVPFPSESPLDSAFEVFPAAPGINAQRAFAVATDGDWLAVGSNLDDVDGIKHAGSVQLFQWSQGLLIWQPAVRLTAETAQEDARFGFALALRGETLAVSALGEGRVYLFQHGVEGWSQQRRLTPSHGPDPGRFGRSLALDGDRLAIGSVDPHGTEAGFVSLFSAPVWVEAEVRPRFPQPAERFGEAVALEDGVLAVGAPGYGSPGKSVKGAVYVFRGPAWKQKALLAGSSAAAGAQLGAAVAIVEHWVLAGAPADGRGTNRGAVYAFPADATGAWTLPGRQLAAGGRDGERLGAALAAYGTILVIGAPSGGGQDQAAGRALVFQSTARTWTKLGEAHPDNAEALDLAGNAVAVSAERVVVGAPLGDQGSGAAGAAWTFRCTANGCFQEGEAVARQPAPEDRFGEALAVDRATGRLAVTRWRDTLSTQAGAVSVFRRAGGGWRQEALIPFPLQQPMSGFGAALALDGDLLAVGAPHDGFSSVSPTVEFPDSGAVYLYQRNGTSWDLKARLLAPQPDSGDSFGVSLSLSKNWLVVGAPGAETVFAYERGLDECCSGVPKIINVLDQPADEKLGFSVSVLNDTLAVGAPGKDENRGAVYTVDLKKSCCTPVRVATEGLVQGDELGKAVAVGEDWLAAGAPGSSSASGAVYLFARSGSSWIDPQLLEGTAGESHRFGAAVSLRGRCLVVGGPGPSPGSNELAADDDEDQAYLFALASEGSWNPKATVDARAKPYGDQFGAGVGLGPGFFAVTNPGPEGGDLVTLFTLREGALCDD
jgi:hypothetical protein